MKHPYLLAVLLPPVAVLLCGAPISQLVLSILLTLCLWVPGVVYALGIVKRHLSDAPTQRVLRAMRSRRR